MAKNRFNRTVVLSVIVLLLGALIILLLYGSQISTDSTSDTISEESQGDTGIEQATLEELESLDTSEQQPSEQTKVSRADLPPLPPADAPLSEQLDDLIELSEAGEPTASCRLIIASNRCRELLRHERFTARMRQSLARSGGRNDGLMIDVVASTELQGQPGFCQNINIDELPSADEVFHRSVSGMSARQKTLLALMRSDGKIRRIRGDSRFTESSLYVVPQFLADNTHSLLLAGYAAFDPLALEGLVLLHAPGMAMGPQGASVWMPNPKEFYKYARLMQDLFGLESIGAPGGRLLQSVQDSLPPSEISRLERVVELERMRWSSSMRGSSLDHSFQSTGSEENAQLSACP